MLLVSVLCALAYRYNAGVFSTNKLQNFKCCIGIEFKVASLSLECVGACVCDGDGDGGGDVIGTTFREKNYICYDAQSTDSDHPRISCANFGFKLCTVVRVSRMRLCVDNSVC